jgi:hypothetical protein
MSIADASNFKIEAKNHPTDAFQQMAVLVYFLSDYFFQRYMIKHKFGFNQDQLGMFGNSDMQNVIGSMQAIVECQQHMQASRI